MNEQRSRSKSGEHDEGQSFIPIFVDQAASELRERGSAAAAAAAARAADAASRAGKTSRALFNRLNAVQRGSPMFAHMFDKLPSSADLRRRALTQIDVVVERYSVGRLRKTHVVVALILVMLYVRYLINFVADSGASWESELEQGLLDPRPGGAASHISWATPLLLTWGYYFFVFIGMRLMENRTPVVSVVFEYMLVYNILLTCLNLFIGSLLLREAWSLGFSVWGNTPSSSPSHYFLGRLIWLQYHSKQLELLDTAFVIVRKKFQSVTFLHTWLRLLNMWGWYFACRFACGGDTYFPAMIHAACQFLVYLYYSVSLAGGKYIPHWKIFRKARVTEVQMLQFVVCAAHAIFVLIWGNIPKPLAAFNIFVMANGLILFLDFHADRYSDSQKVNEQHSEKGRVVYSFDSSGWLYVYHFGVALWIEENLIPQNRENYPDGLAFSGSSGGALVACALAVGVQVSDLWLYVIDTCWKLCHHNPCRMLAQVEKALDMFLKEDSAKEASGKLRVLLTKVSWRPPFFMGEINDTFPDLKNLIGVLRASSHIPVLGGLGPYKLGSGRYFDGFVWSTMFVPWRGERNDKVIRVSAYSAPGSDIKPGLVPPWWTVIPPEPDVLRGMFWTGYLDAAKFFQESQFDQQMSCGNCVKRRHKSDTPPKESPNWLALHELHAKGAHGKNCARRDADVHTGKPIEFYLDAYKKGCHRAWRRLIYFTLLIIAVVFLSL